MATNEILPFAATDTGTNLLTQVEYNGDAQRPIGNQPGIARSKLVNKVLRQASLVAAAVAQYIADNQLDDVVDTLTPAQLATMFENALGAAFQPKDDTLTQLAAGNIGEEFVSNATSAIQVPQGTSAQRPTGADGKIRFNSDLNTFEGYKSGSWGAIGGGATGATGDEVFYENEQNVTGSYEITAGRNAMSAGPITIDNGVTVTVPTGSTWTIV